MKKFALLLVLLLTTSLSFTSCREVESDAEDIEEVEMDDASTDEGIIEE